MNYYHKLMMLALTFLLVYITQSCDIKPKSSKKFSAKLAKTTHGTDNNETSTSESETRETDETDSSEDSSNTGTTQGIIQAIGGIGSDNFTSVIQTSDGSLVAVGNTNSDGAGGKDGFIVKFNSDGSIIWDKTIGGSSDDDFYSVIETRNRNLVIVGDTDSDGAGGRDLYLIKLNSDGAVLWNKAVGGSDWETLPVVIEASDGNLVIASSTTSDGDGLYDAFFIKLKSSDASTIWSKIIGGAGVDMVKSLTETHDGGLVAVGSVTGYVCGKSTFHCDFDAYLIKLTSTGELVWTKTMGGTHWDFFGSVIETSDRNLVMVGRTLSDGVGCHDGIIVKLDQSGTIVWSKTVGGTNFDSFTSVIETNDNNLVAAGISNANNCSESSTETQADSLLVKINSSDGSIIWNKNVTGTNLDLFTSVIETSDGSLVAVGSTNSGGAGSTDGFFVKVASNGNSSSNWVKDNTNSNTEGNATNANTVANADNINTIINGENAATVEEDLDNITTEDADEADTLTPL